MWGGGGAPLSTSPRSTHVAGTTQARRRHEERHLSLCRGGGGLSCGSRRRPSYPAFAPPVVPPLGLAWRVLPTGTVVWSVPHPLSAASPPCRCVLRGGGRCPPPPSFIPHSWGGGGVWGGGGGLSSSLRGTHVAGTTQARRKHEVSHLSLCRGGGLAVWLPSSPFLPCVRTPGGPPVGACMARAPYGHGRVVRPAPSLRCLPTLPLCPRGGGALSAPPFLHPPPLGGRRCVGGGGAPLSSSLRSTHVACTTQARRKHEVRHLAAAGGGGFLLWAFAPFSMVEVPHPMITSPCCPLAVVATSPQGAQCPVPAPSCAHTYWRRYVPGWKRMKRKCGQRGGLTVRLEGFLRHPPPWSRGGPLFRHPIARGGATAHPLPGACVSTSERPDTGAVVSVRWKWRLQSGRALSSPGSLPPPSAMEAPEVLWQRHAETGGGFICGIPWPSS